MKSRKEHKKFILKCVPSRKILSQCFMCIYIVLREKKKCFDPIFFFYRLCQLCYPEVSCDLCEEVEEPETANEEAVEESDVADCYDEYAWKSLQSLSQLAIDEPENVRFFFPLVWFL